MKKIVTPFKVGLLVLAAGVAFILFVTFVKKSRLNANETLTVFALFRDASGLGAKSRVQTAGIPIGEIADIRLQGTRARVTLRVRKDLPLHTDATIAKRSESMLGDYMLDLTPGTESAPLMPEGGQIRTVYDKTGMDQTLDRMNTIAADIQEVTSSLRQVLGGERGAGNLQSIMENLVQLSTAMDKTIMESSTKLNQVLGNLEGASAAVRDITTSQEQDYRQIIANVRGATQDVRDVLATVKQVLGSGEGDIRESVAGLKQTLNHLDDSLKHIQSVTGKIDQGEGAIGALVSDKQMGEDLSRTVSDASDFVNRIVGLLTEVTLRSEYLFNQGGAKNYIQLKLIPKPDKYYFFEIVDDPRGVTTQESVLRLPPDALQRELQTTFTTKEQLKYSAEFAKRYYFATFRFGIIESTGGVGASFNFLNDSLILTVDLFEFGTLYKTYPRLRAFANYSFLGHLFITGGVDDVLNRTLYDTDLVSPAARDVTSRRIISGRDFFVGGGVVFTDDDVKSILGGVPMPK